MEPTPLAAAINQLGYLTDGPLCSSGGHTEVNLEKLDAACVAYLRVRRKLMSPTVYRALSAGLVASCIEGQVTVSHKKSAEAWLERFKPVVMNGE